MSDDEFEEIEQMPYSPTTEAALLGAVLIHPAILKTLPTSPDDFYIERHKFIFTSFHEITRAGGDIDLVSVCSTLDRRGQLAEVGGKAAIMALCNSTPSSMHADTYAKILRGFAIRRSVIEVTRNLTQAAFDKTSDLNMAISKAQSALSRAVVSVDRGLQPISSYLMEVYNQVEELAANPREIYGIPTGLIGIDKINHGFQKGTTTILSGEAGLGKSLLACQILANAARAGHPGGLYEFEMNRGQVMRRLISSRTHDNGAGVTTYKMQSGRFTDADWDPFTHAIEELSQLPVYMTDKKLSVMEWRADLARAIETWGIEEVVVDYFRLFADRIPDANERDAYLSEMIHDAAKEFNVHILVIDTLNKEGQWSPDKGKAGLSGSGFKGYDADEIIFIRKVQKPEGAIGCFFEKCRDVDLSGGNVALLTKLPDYPKFADYQSDLTGGKKP